jgi:hypothetical protein
MLLTGNGTSRMRRRAFVPQFTMLVHLEVHIEVKMYLPQTSESLANGIDKLV